MNKGSDLLVAALENEEVERIFGVPGEENLDVMESLRSSNLAPARGDSRASGRPGYREPFSVNAPAYRPRCSPSHAGGRHRLSGQWYSVIRISLSMRSHTVPRDHALRRRTGWLQLWKRHSRREASTWSLCRWTTPKTCGCWSTSCASVYRPNPSHSPFTLCFKVKQTEAVRLQPTRIRRYAHTPIHSSPWPACEISKGIA